MRCIVIFSKAPIPGEVKTRLTSHISAEEAACLQKAFVFDTLTTTREIDDADIYVACHPGREHEFFLGLERDFPVKLIEQGNGNLGDRMKRVIESLQVKGYIEVVLIGSDSPTVTAELLQEAFKRLKREDLVIGPSLDGGYYLLAVSGTLPDIFDGVSWGSDKVFSETMERVKRDGTGFSILPFWYDVDTIQELRFLNIHLSSLSSSSYAETRGALNRLGKKVTHPELSREYV